ncbi:MAG TPA: V-type ATP synthase subunit F, partial [Acidimicrobiales bacterium]|nr:V-type ATP synthase subunit F [Acidimicrobiales bacterium]
MRDSVQAFCIADEDTVRGFRLAGVAGEVVSTPREAAEALARARQLPDCALLILTEQVCSGLGPELSTLRLECNRPLVVEIPGPGGPMTAAGRPGLGR